MALFRDINFPDTDNLREDIRQYQIELERKLKYILRNLSNENFSLSLAPNRLTQSSSTGALTVVNLLSNYISGTDITVTDDGAGGVILSGGSGGSGILNVTTVTGTTTLDTNDVGVILGNSGSAFTINLPTAVGNLGVNYSITNINSGVITVDANGSQTIQGSLTQTINADENLKIVSNGTNWFFA